MSTPSHDPKGILVLARSGVVMAVLGMALFLGCSGGSHPAAPVINDFTAWPATITAGQGTYLTFNFSGDHGGSVDQGIGSVPSGGSLLVTPTATTTYTLTANNDGVVRTSTVTVTVKAYTPKYVYVACTGTSGGLYGFTLNDATGALTPITHSSPETLTPGFHVTGDPLGRFLFVVNGDGGVTALGKLSVYQINATTGALTAVTPAVATANSPWCAAVDPSGRFVYVRCDSAISAFSLDGTTGVLTSLGAAIPTSAGRGDVIVHPSGKYLFTVGKASNSIDVFEINATTGALTQKGSPYLLPAGTGPVSLALNATGEFLYTKGEGAPGAQASNAIYGYRLGFSTGLLTPLGSGALVSGLLAEDAYHGLFASPNQNVLYGTFGNASPAMDVSAYNLNPATGALTLGPTSPYAWFAGNASDCITLTRHGKWAFITNYYGSQLATASVDPLTGALTRINPTSGTVGNFPVSATVVGVLQ